MAGEIDWDVSVDSTVVRAHQHAAGARNEPPPASKRGTEVEHQDETAWQSLLARLAEVVREVRAWNRSRRGFTTKRRRLGNRMARASSTRPRR